MWVTPLSAFVTPVPPTASYYTVPTYCAPAAPMAYGAPMVYSEALTCGAPMVYEQPMAYDPSCAVPGYYGAGAAPFACGVPSVSGGLPRGEYQFGRCLAIVQ